VAVGALVALRSVERNGAETRPATVSAALEATVAAPVIAPRATATPAATAEPNAFGPEVTPLPVAIDVSALRGEERALAEAVNLSNAVQVQAFQSLDPAPLAAAFSGVALLKYREFLVALKADGHYVFSEPKQIRLLSIRLIDPANAEVITEETWYYDEFSVVTNQRIPGYGRETVEQDTYLLVKRDGRWLVQGLGQTTISETLR